MENKSERNLLPTASADDWKNRDHKSGCRLFLTISVALFLFSVAVLLLCTGNSTVAEAYSGTVSAFLRAALAVFTASLPFSLAETFVLVAPCAFLILLVRAVVRRFVGGRKGTVKRFIVRVFCLVLCLLSLAIQTFFVCYKRQSVAERWKLDTAALTEDDLYASAAITLHLAEHYRNLLTADAKGTTQIPYNFSVLTQKVRKGYETFLPMPPVLSIKPVALSEAWTYTHITGMYMPLTGESNINMNFPGYVRAFTVCHEVAHQLGIAYESEANFYAFLACMLSEDDYLRYAGALNAFEYLAADLETEKAVVLYRAADMQVLNEIRAFNAFFEKYLTSSAAKVSDTINDGYLKSQGVVTGTKNYSEVSRLIAAYLKQQFPEYYA